MSSNIKNRMFAQASSVALMASFAVMALSAGSAMAQTAAGEDVVVVTGIKRSLQDSIALKRKSSSIIEAVSAEEIGKLPDVSIADSLARLPGLAGQRVNGRASQINIRGLGGDFGSTLLNGRLQVSTGDNRAAEFDQYPGELISRGVVYKTPDAGLVGQGLSGTVDLSTVHPLDFKNRVMAFGVRGSVNGNKDNNGNGSASGNRLNFTYIDQFMDGKVGVAFGYAHLDDPTSVKHFKYWGWEQSNPNVGWGSAPVNSQTQFDAAHKDAWRLGGFEATNVTRTQIRDGYMGVVEFKPNDNFHSVNDFYYSKYEQEETMHGLMGSLGVWGGGDPVVNRPHYTGATFAPIAGAPASAVGANMYNNGGTVSNILLANRSDFNTRSDEMFSFGSRNTWTMGGWDMLFDVATSNAKRKEVSMETFAGIGSATSPLRSPAPANFGSLTYTIPNDGPMHFSSSLNYGNAANLLVGDSMGWGQAGNMQRPVVKDAINQVRLSGKHQFDFGVFKAADIGIAYSTREKSKSIVEYNLCVAGLNPNCNSFSMAIPANMATSSDFGYLGLGKVAGIDAQAALNAGLLYRKPVLDTNHYNKEWTIEEKIATAYVKLDIDTSFIGIPVTGNVGVQIVNSTQHSIGSTIRSGSPVVIFPYDKEVSYTDTLPSLNLAFDLSEKSKLRFGLGRTLARARMDQMRANSNARLAPRTATVGEARGVWSGSGGNPNLKPWLADAFDVSYEYYISKQSYVSVAFFDKHLLNYIYTRTNKYFDFTGYPIDPVLPGGTVLYGTFADPTNPASITGTATAPDNRGSFTTPENGQGGHVGGVEFAVTLQGELFLPALEGFGLQASVSKNWNDVKPGGPTSTDRLPGFSANTRNVTFYYERYGFSARISERVRAAERGEIATLFAERGYALIPEDKQTDAQISYKFEDGTLKGLTLLLQANNLTDSPYRDTNDIFPGGTSRRQVYDTYGKQILFGFSYKM